MMLLIPYIIAQDANEVACSQNQMHLVDLQALTNHGRTIGLRISTTQSHQCSQVNTVNYQCSNTMVSFYNTL